MTIQTLSAREAFSTLNANPNGRWPTRDKDPDRLYPIATPSSRPRFRIDPSDKVFCLGSCFAREIEEALKRLGFDVTSIIRGLHKSPRWEKGEGGAFNKYTIASILNEIRWALDPSTQYSPSEHLIENTEGMFEDYQLKGRAYADTWEDLCKYREGFNRRFKAVGKASLIVLTLGLSEAWFDRGAGIYLNVTPSPRLLDKYPNRFELRVLDYEESLASLEQVYSLLTRYGHPDQKMLLTVSPVPLIATFRDQDVLVANAYSKAVLRAVAEKFQSMHERVSYFPSYEFVTLSHPETVWADRDFRHVDRSFVEHIMSSVLGAFMGESEAQREMSHFARACALHRAKRFAEAAAMLAPVVTDPEKVKNPHVLSRWAILQNKLGNRTVAIKTLELYLERRPDDEKRKLLLMTWK